MLFVRINKGEVLAAPNTNRNKEILDCYFGKPNQQNPHVAEGQNINKALGMMAFEFFRIDISQLRLTNDEELVGHVLVLEQLSDQVGALDRLLDKHPAFMDGWTKRKKKLFHQRMNTLRSIALYYQTRKTIICDAAS